MFYQANRRNNDQFIRTNATLIGDSHALMSLAVETIEQLTALNMAYAMESLNHGAQHAYTVLDVEHPHQAFALQADQIHPASEKFVSYTVKFFEITNQASAKMTNLLNAHFQEMGQELERHSIEAAQSAPMGSEVALAAVKQTIEASKAAYEKARTVVNQAAELGNVQTRNVARTATKTIKRQAAKK